jgi:hypothetical protein
MFFPVAERGIACVTVQSFRGRPRSGAAAPRHDSVIGIWIWAVFTAEPGAMLRSAIRIEHWGQKKSVVLFLRFLTFFGKLLTVCIAACPTVDPTVKLPFAPVMTQAGHAVYFCIPYKETYPPFLSGFRQVIHEGLEIFSFQGTDKNCYPHLPPWVQCGLQVP